MLLNHGHFRIMCKRPATLLIHIAFAVMVVGGVVTWLTSRQGSITVWKECLTDTLTLNSGDSFILPFAVQLSHFEVVNYPGTDSPMDYRCKLCVTDNTLAASNDAHPHTAVTHGSLAMNHVFSYRHYRFYIHSYLPDADKVQLSVFFDPYGIAITYTGYALLLFSLILFFFERRSTFRALLHQFNNPHNTKP